ncbi:MAG: peptidoglycan-binding domain-containing protein, partial [Candidatus Omnitrophota bacterium]
MVKKVFMLFLLGVFTVFLSSCATTRKYSDSEIASLKNQISLLEEKLKDKEDEIYGLKEASMKGEQFKSSKKVVGEVKSRPNVKQIQMALQGAGYNPGPIDGRMGKQTRSAIRQFQSAHNLAVDGKVGKKTWA